MGLLGRDGGVAGGVVVKVGGVGWGPRDERVGGEGWVEGDECVFGGK